MKDKKPKGLTKDELIKKYEAGSIDFSKLLKPSKSTVSIKTVKSSKGKIQ